MNWNEFLNANQSDANELFSDPFLRHRGNETWEPSQDDRKAAILLHTQIASRITTQRLGYLDGLEKSALDSVYALFKATREINDRFPEARHFDAAAWDVLNIRVRPFTAKWHSESERGGLAALDATDEFRAQLTQLQVVLRRFDNFLLKLHDEKEPTGAGEGLSEREEQVANEMAAEVRFGIPLKYGGINDDEQAKAINKFEKQAVEERRSQYGASPDKAHAVGLALSGGGIRSATFSLGVLVALAERGLLPQIDYLSTVSGGGYIGSFLSAFLNSAGDREIGLRSAQLPFRREAGEAQALRHIRHYCKYLLIGSLWQQAAMVSAQLYGMILNGLVLGLLVTLAVAVERLLRRHLPSGALGYVTAFAVIAVTICALFSFLSLRAFRSWQKIADRAMAVSVAFLFGITCVHGLDPAHRLYGDLLKTQPSVWGIGKWLGFAGAVPLITSALATLFGRLLKHLTTVFIVLTGIAAPLFVFGLYLALYELADRRSFALSPLPPVCPDCLLWAAILVGGVGYLFLFDINSTSPHRHYRDRLANTFLIQRRKTGLGASSQEPKNRDANDKATTNQAPTQHDLKNKNSGFDAGVSIRLSQLTSGNCSPYHLINCALNVPGSKNIAMQGRLTDFFLFTPGFSGSPLTGYYSTKDWEAADSHLDLGTAMAISAAAAAPQMGLGTMKTLRFWLALLNIRLGYWAKKPKSKLGVLTGAPGLSCLFREMLGTMNEKSSWLNLTDGGHIENLGVYELLRRRCKYIIAIDGEEDSKMTFQALTTLQRLAAIDFGVRIDVNLDDLRLNDQRLSRSHFRFCRVRYPKQGRGSSDEFGYLLYVKLSLTGNEGEFIRRYRLDNPAFPHDPTTNQFFTEAQFEAYRSLGEHVGDKLFLRAIVGDFADTELVDLEHWFLRLGKAVLDPLPKLVPQDQSRSETPTEKSC